MLLLFILFLIVSTFIFMGCFCFSGWLEWFQLPSLCLYESLTVEPNHFCCYNAYFILIKSLLKDASVGSDPHFLEYVAFHNVPIATGHNVRFTYNGFCLKFSYVISFNNFVIDISPLFHSSDFLLYASKYIKVL